MIKKKKIILISVAVTVALAVGVSGLVYAQFPFPHEDVGGHKLIGVGEMGYESYSMNGGGSDQWWDTQFIITNPNCKRDLTIKWVALIAGEDACEYYAEEVIFEGTPDDWADYTSGEMEILIPSNEESEIGVLSPHEVWQVSIAELMAGVWDGPDPEEIPSICDLGKYTLEVTWSGAYYSWWSHWGRLRPLTGWQKEKCWYVIYSDGNGPMGLPGMAISEAEMKLFPSRTHFSPPEWWYEPK